jgi:hypothetical protein
MAGPEDCNQIDPTKISREQRGEMFTYWAADKCRDETLFYRTEPEMAFLARRYRQGLLERAYYTLLPNSNFRPVARFTENNGLTQIMAGTQEEGRQLLRQKVDGDIFLGVYQADMEMFITYDKDGKMWDLMFGKFDNAVDTIYFEFKPPVCEQPSFARTPRSPYKYYIRNVQESEPVKCYVDEGAGKQTLYKLPRSVDLEECISKLVPAELRENLLLADISEDKWRTADFLQAFGIEKEYIEESREIEL